MPGAIIERGDRVTLRTVERDDAPFVQRGYTNPEIRYPLGNLRHKNLSQIEAQFENFIENPSHAQFLVCLDAEDAGPGHPDDGDVTPIGAVAATDTDQVRPELAYWLVPEYHGDGYGSEAVALVVNHVFQSYDTPSISAATLDFNEASRSLLESLGFTEEGRLRKARFIGGEYRDSIEYGLLREEWHERDES
ncbi:GNAT family N-acetyltransferase [Halorussus amylolyticus]|uniref:GNAT family N-acetyltransferase n=1 Tax=Halorussus amylolyticus TaxID=1126242 RepID=UPI001042DA19|nr:GNAT family protein [Halorussus amylolyticus]